MTTENALQSTHPQVRTLMQIAEAGRVDLRALGIPPEARSEWDAAKALLDRDGTCSNTGRGMMLAYLQEREKARRCKRGGFSVGVVGGALFFVGGLAGAVATYMIARQ